HLRSGGVPLCCFFSAFYQELRLSGGNLRASLRTKPMTLEALYGQCWLSSVRHQWTRTGRAAHLAHPHSYGEFTLANCASLPTRASLPAPRRHLEENHA